MRADVLTALRALRRRWWLVTVCWTFTVVAAFALTATQEKEYTAKAGLLFRDPGLDQKLFGTTFLAPNRDPDREAATNVKLVSLEVVAKRTANRIGGLTASEVGGMVEAEAEGQSDVVSVAATHRDPEFARRLANTFASQYIAFRRDADRGKMAGAVELVQRQLSALTPEQRTGEEGRSLKERADQLEVMASLQQGNAELVQPAQTPTSPSSPKVKRNIALAIFVGLLLGVGFALLLHRLDRRIREPEELEESLELPVLGLVPRSAAFARKNGFALTALSLPHSEGEAFRMLRARMRYFNVDREVRKVLVSSGSAGEGKSTVSLHLAAAAASTGSRVLLIEADLRRPTLMEALNRVPTAGLAEVLTRNTTFDEAVQELEPGGANGVSASGSLDVLSAGFPPPNPAELLESQRMRELLQQVEAEYDLVVIDTPPMLVVSDALPLIGVVDGVVIVSRLGVTTRDAARRLGDQLRGLNAPVLGVVANGLKAKGEGYGYYGYETKRVEAKTAGAA